MEQVKYQIRTAQDEIKVVTITFQNGKPVSHDGSRVLKVQDVYKNIQQLIKMNRATILAQQIQSILYKCNSTYFYTTKSETMLAVSYRYAVNSLGSLDNTKYEITVYDTELPEDDDIVYSFTLDRKEVDEWIAANCTPSALAIVKARNILRYLYQHDLIEDQATRAKYWLMAA